MSTTPPHIYIPSHGRATTISTHRLLGDLPYSVVINTVQERDQYLAAAASTGIDPDALIVSNQGRTGQQVTRQAILAWQTPGTWHVQLDDDIEHLYVVPDPWYDEDDLPVQEDKAFRARFATPASPARIARLLAEWQWRAEEVGAHLAGPASNDNFYFRGRHWRTVGAIPGTMFLIKRDRLAFPMHNTIEDFYMTALHLEAHGAVLIDNYAYPQAGHWHNQGGISSYQGDRVAQRTADCADLLARFPGLWRYKDRFGHDNYDVTMRLHSPEQIRAWRATMRARRAVGSAHFKEATR